MAEEKRATTEEKRATMRQYRVLKEVAVSANSAETTSSAAAMSGRMTYVHIDDVMAGNALHAMRAVAEKTGEGEYIAVPVANWSSEYLAFEPQPPKLVVGRPLSPLAVDES